MSDFESDSEVLDKVDLQEPGMYNVLLLNDNYTTMDFVVAVLMQIFGKTSEQAMDIMLSVHEHGKGIAGTYVQDIAETKSNMVHKAAKEYGFPLKTKIERA